MESAVTLNEPGTIAAMNLTRNAHSRCVMARICRQKIVTRRNFSLHVYGSWRKAAKAARRWVRLKLAELPEPTSMKDRKTARNSSGVVGVRLADATRKRGPKLYPDWRWVALWPQCPKSGGIGWSVNKYGDERAFISAFLARESESVDRDAIEAEVKRLKGTSRYRKALARKRQTPPADAALAATRR